MGDKRGVIGVIHIVISQADTPSAFLERLLGQCGKIVESRKRREQKNKITYVINFHRIQRWTQDVA